MLNVITQQQKIELQKEYSQRRIVLWLSLLISVLAVSLILLLPSYLLTKLKAAEVTGELEHSKQVLSDELLPEDISKNLTAALGLAEALRPLKEPLSPYDLIRIFENRPGSIKITSIEFQNKNEKDAPSVTIRGVADNRESLTSFVSMLENQTEFESVDLPVSNFVKEVNIDFSMTIKVKRQQ